MAGKRLLDLAALFNASRGVVQKHIALTSRQVDVYNRTSTLARAVRSQTDRVTETAKAASFLASRLNESAPTWASESRDDKRSNDEELGPRGTVHSTEPGLSLDKDGPLPTSSSTSSIRTPIESPLSSNAARILQRRFERQIPSQTADAAGDPVIDPLDEGHDADSFYQRSGHTSPALSSLPRVKIPKHPSISQGTTVLSPAKQINSDSFYDTGELQEVEQNSPLGGVPEQEKIPEDVNMDIFHSRRVATLLGGKIQGGARPRGLESNGSNNMPVENIDKAQETFNTRISPQTPPMSQDVTANPRFNTPESSADAHAGTGKLAQDFQPGTLSESVKVRRIWRATWI
jgi:aarF domain-containing kinase